MKRLIRLAALLLIGHPALAEPPAALCAAAKKEVRADSLLASEVAAVFGKADFAGAESDCLYPLKVLRYASADVLLVQAGVPGEGCHGCEATLSTYVNQRVGGGLKTVAKFREFARLGSHGSVMDVWPIEIAGDDAMAIESAGRSRAIYRRISISSPSTPARSPISSRSRKLCSPPTTRARQTT